MDTAARAAVGRQLVVSIPSVVVRVLQALAGVATVGLMLHVVANALLRTFYQEPIRATLEYVQYWYVPVIALLGFVVAEGRRAHIEANLVFERLGSSSQVGVQLVTRLVALLAAAAFAYFSFGEAVEAMRTTRTAGSLRITVWPVWFAVPLAFGLLTVSYLAGVVRHGWSMIIGRTPEGAAVGEGTSTAARDELTP